MVDILMKNIVEISIGVSLVLMALLFLSPLLGRRFSAKWRYWVWLILAVRLLIPLNIPLPQAPIRIELPTALEKYEVTSAQVSPIQGLSGPSTEVPPPGLSMSTEDERTNRILSTPSPETTEKAGAILPAKTPKAWPMPTPAELAVGVWAGGAGIYLLWQLMGYAGFLRFVRRWSRPVKNERIQALFGEMLLKMRADVRLSLAVCPGLASPMITGFLRPVLLLPSEDFTENELGFILSHELVHYQRGDINYKLLIMLANAVHWFNPLVWMMAREANRDLEIACDEAVAKDLSTARRAEYGEIILATVRAGSSLAPAFSTYFYGGSDTIAKRLKSIFDTEKKGRGALALAAVLVLTAGVGTLVACGSAPEPEAERLPPREVVLDYLAAFSDGDSGEQAALSKGEPIVLKLPEGKFEPERAEVSEETSKQEGLMPDYLDAESGSFGSNYSLVLAKIEIVDPYGEAQELELSFVLNRAGESAPWLIESAEIRRRMSSAELLLTEETRGDYYCVTDAPQEFFGAKNMVQGSRAVLERWGKQILNSAPEQEEKIARLKTMAMASPSCELSTEDVVATLDLLAQLPPQLELTEEPPDNPATGGGWSIVALDSKDRILWSVGSDGFWFFISDNGSDHVYNIEEAGKVWMEIDGILSRAPEDEHGTNGESIPAGEVSTPSAGTSTPALPAMSTGMNTSKFYILGDSAEIDSKIIFSKSKLGTERNLGKFHDLMGEIFENGPDEMLLWGGSTDFKGKYQLKESDIAQLSLMLRAIDPELFEKSPENQWTGGGWKIIVGSGEQSCFIGYNGACFTVLMPGESKQLIFDADTPNGDCGIGRLIWALTYGESKALEEKYKGESVTMLYAYDEQGRAYHPVDKRFVWEGAAMLNGYKGAAGGKIGYFIVTDKGKYSVYLDDSRPQFLATLWMDTVATTPALVQWLAYMDPEKLSTVKYSGRIISEELDGFENVTWDSAAAAKDPLVNKKLLARDILQTAEFLNVNMPTEELISKYKGGGYNPNAVYASSWAMEMKFTTGVSYKLNWSDGFLAIYASDLDYTLCYRIDKKVGLELAKFMSMLTSTEPI